MGKLKKIALVFLFIVASVGIFILYWWAHYPLETLEISGKATSTPLGSFSCRSIGDEMALYSEGLMIEVEPKVRFSFYRDIYLEELRYRIYLEDFDVGEGSFHEITLDRGLYSNELPVIQHSLNMNEISDEHPQLIEAASENRGLLQLRVVVDLSSPALLLDVVRIGTATISSELSFNINFLDTISVSSFEWKSGYSTVYDCNPGVKLVGEFEAYKWGSLAKNVDAEILEIVDDGSTRSSSRIALDEELREGFNVLDVSWIVPESPPMDCVGYSIRLIYEDVEVWSQPLISPSLPLFRVLPLLEAFTKDGITITLSGRGACSGDAINLTIKAEIETSLDLKVESGTVLVNSGAGQNMIIAESRYVRIEPEIKIEVKLKAYCLDMHKNNPSSEEVFTISEYTGYCLEALELIQSLNNVTYEYKSLEGIQLALWVVIEDPTRSEVTQIFHISESGLEDAAWLIENIGIDHTQKNLWIEL